MPRADHPPRVLGTIAKNQRWAMTKDFDEKDDEEADPARLAIKRAEAARKLCEAIKEMSVADVEGPSIAAGWAIMSKSAARALDFDARLTASSNTLKSTRNPGKHPERHNGSTGWHTPERRRTQHRLSTWTTGRMQSASTLQHRSRRSFSELMDLHPKSCTGARGCDGKTADA